MLATPTGSTLSHASETMEAWAKENEQRSQQDVTNQIWQRFYDLENKHFQMLNFFCNQIDALKAQLGQQKPK